MDIYTDPVTLMCGHSFCGICITKTWDNQEAREYSCPECRQRFRVRPELKKNLRLWNIVETFLPTYLEHEEVRIHCTYCVRSPVLAVKTCRHCHTYLCDYHLKIHRKSPEHVFEEPNFLALNRKCPVHKKVLEYYCWEDTACICVTCKLDGEHREHQVETLNEASEKKKRTLKNILWKLTSQREEAEKRVLNLRELRRQVQLKADSVRDQVTALIRDIREELEALEKRVLTEISRQEEQVSLRVSDLILELELQKYELARKMGHIEELCRRMDPLTVLQKRESGGVNSYDIEEGDHEDRERHDTQTAGDLDVGLIAGILHRQLNDFMNGAKRHHDKSEVSNSILDINVEFDVSLDVNTASSYVALSGDLKTVSRPEVNQKRPETPERFQYYPQVLSSRCFSSGRHYWEVETSETGGWIIGVTYPSIDRRGPQSLIGHNELSWGLEMCNDHYSALHGITDTPLPALPSCRRLGISLDYEAGRLSFYELSDPIRHLHTFTATFTELLHLGFWVEVNTWIRIR
uniref:Uncharacterized protein n=1 Tax=Leptobrachium leishanense TaxID=445787 RepID=A0A8C5M849_9ANUR